MSTRMCVYPRPRESKHSMCVNITLLSHSAFSQNHMDKFKQFLFFDTIPYPPNLEGKSFCLSRRSRSEEDGKKSNSVKRLLEAWLSYLMAGTGRRWDQQRLPTSMLLSESRTHFPGWCYSGTAPTSLISPSQCLVLL